ncbi:MAG TPA: sigma-54-dependent Fis family transcriptional regulator [Selenomonadales bacterium]|nr:sigma-54-dependent Fis family transcriptional regulator [Selenomonadales bacterium]
MRFYDLMNTEVAALRPEMTMRQAAELFREKKVGGAPVVDAEGMLIGLINRSHFVKVVAAGGAPDRLVGELMTRDVYCLDADMTVSQLQQRKELYQYSYFPVVDRHKRPVGCIHRNDLIRYLSERSLFLAEELQAVLDSVRSGVVAVNADGIITQFNPAAERITGLRAELAVGRNAADIIPNTGMQRVLATGMPELNQKQNLGNCEIITHRSPIIKGKMVMGAVAVFQDVTEMEKIAAELENVKELQSTLESAIESVVEGICVVDKDGILKMMNRSYGEFIGVDAEEMIGRHVTEVIPNTRMHIVAQTGKPEIGDVQRINNNNVVVTRIPIIKDGEVVGAVGKVLFRDLKDFKMLARKLTDLQSELEYYKEELAKAQGGKHTLDNIIGASEKLVWLKAIAARAAKGASTILILGESGTGKEVFANAIHNASPRRYGPFIKVNCAAVPENLLESELFGYEEGAFTGARKGGKPGKFELANGGTIFLDEIGDMTMAMQAKLLRVLQEREYERVGGTKTLKTDVRVVAATNRNLEGMIEKGEFRQDLYYRLNVITITIPPLRERREDIASLSLALLKKINSQLQCGVEGVSPEAMHLLREYNWPGNVRELENVLERAVNLIDDEVSIQPWHLPPLLKQGNKAGSDRAEMSEGLSGVLVEAEKEAICKALEAAGGNRSKAAKLLGIHRSGLYQKLQKYHIKPVADYHG